jgi:hypothetical protein
MNENSDIIGNAPASGVTPIIPRSQQQCVQAMVGFPQPVKLSPAEADAFRKLQQRKIALQTWTQMIAEQGEQRMRAIVEDEQKAVLALAKSYALDVERVMYSFDPATDTFVPMQMRMR